MENPAPAVFLYGAPEDYANYRAALTSAGLRPVVSRSLAAALGCEALLLPGGGDIHGSLPPEESFLLHAFWDAHRPILGICRGMQVMNIVKGGGIYQDIGVQAGTTLKHIQQAPRSYGTHSIFVEDNTLLTDLWENKRTVVNSLHHQSCSTLGEGFIVSARSADGLIEAIEHKDNRFAVGVQWHPEAMKTEEMGLLFSAFLKAAAEYQQARR